MYVFALALLFGLGVMVLAGVIDRYLSRATEAWAAATVILGVAFAWIANFNMWAFWNVPIRADWMGVTLSGLAVAGLAYLWRDVVGLIASLYRKYTDEATEIERNHGLHRVA